MSDGSRSAVDKDPLTFDLFDLLQRCRGDESFMAMMLDKFAKNAPASLDMLRSAIDEGRNEDAVRAAHMLSGAAANMAAVAVCRSAHEIEQSCRNGEFGKAEDLLERLAGEIAQCVESVPKIVSGITAE